MTALMTRLGSLRLTLAGMVGMLVMLLLVYRAQGVSLSWLALPLGFLGLNLFAAILTNRSFRVQSALLLFHLGLLGILVLAGAGVLMGMDGRVEVIEGERFDAERVDVVSRGWLYPGGLDTIDFVQGTIVVNYLDGLIRGGTRSEVVYPRRADAEVIGDRIGFESGGHRLLATFNKGFALVLEWSGDDGQRALGAVNLPSYPEFEWRQRNEWRTPAGEPLTLELEIADRVPERGSWTLSSQDVDYRVNVVRRNSSDWLLEGESLRLEGGSLRVADLRMWMGYRIDHNPLLPWLLASAFLTLGALGWYYRQKFTTTAVVPRAERQPA